MGGSKGLVRREVLLRGVVQGVGLRPWAAQRARALGLSGSIRNESHAVRVTLEGQEADATRWLEELREAPPAGTVLTSVETQGRPVANEHGFAILASRHAPSGRVTPLPPDVAVCEDCLAELFDPSNRRHRYAFTHCAACGPRASVLRGLPYDRERTTLGAFPPCAACAREYADPEDRRHHAQTVACPACGPTLRAERDGRALGGEPVELAAEELARGGIVALKGYGGFHLLVDATRPAAVARLRARKGRPTRPLGVLLPSLEAARALAELGTEDERRLAGPERVLVVAPRRAGDAGGPRLAEGVAPGLDDLGVLLPIAPLHWLLLHAPGSCPGSSARFSALVFTSANRSGEPTLYEDREARAKLAGLADLLVTHDREVARPSDDPVYRSSPRGPIPIRLSRATSPRTAPSGRPAHGRAHPRGGRRPQVRAGSGAR